MEPPRPRPKAREKRASDQDRIEDIQLARSDSALADALYLQADKLLALCSLQAALPSADYAPSPATRNHYSLVMEEQALELRRLLDQLFI